MTRSRGRARFAEERRTRQLLAVVQELYASAMQGTAEIWHKIYEQSSLLLESEAGGFISTDKVNQAADIASLIGFDQQRAIQAYRDYGVEVDLLFMGTLAMHAGETFLGTEKIGFRALQRSPFYGILSRPLGLRYVCGGILENDEHHHSALYFWRRRDQPDFDQSAMGTLATVLPHVRQALEVQRRLRGPRLDALAPGNLSLDTFQGSRHGILVLGGRGQVLFANREGERILRAADGIGIAHGVLAVEDSPGAAEVERMMTRGMGIARDAAFSPMRPIRIPRPSGGPPHDFLIIPVTDGLQRAILPAGAAFIVAVTDPAGPNSPDADRLRRYGPTSAEARLCGAGPDRVAPPCRGPAEHQPQHGPEPSEERLREAGREFPGPAGDPARRGAGRRRALGAIPLYTVQASRPGNRSGACTREESPGSGGQGAR